MFDIYSNDDSINCRFTLGKKGDPLLLVLGLNPSTATNIKSDTTIAKVSNVAKNKGFNGFVMANLYPLRATDPNQLPDKSNVDFMKLNWEHIESLLKSSEFTTIWCAWGGDIIKKPYLLDSLLVIKNMTKKYNVKFSIYGSLTAKKHPRHPSRLSYKWEFQDFDINTYLKALNK